MNMTAGEGGGKRLEWERERGKEEGTVTPRLGVKDATWNERVEAGNLLRVLMKPNKNTVFK